MKTTNLPVAVVVLAMILGAAVRAEEAKPVAATTTNAPVTEQAVIMAPAKPRASKRVEEDAQGRLQPTTPEKLIEKHGAVGSIFAKPAKVNPLQLINPLAPREYGGVGQPSAAWSWNPMLAPGQGPLPRSFQDDRTHEAAGVLFSAGSR